MEDFGSDVGWCATESSGEGFLANDFCETEVGELDGQVFVVKKDVFGFDVAVDDASFVLVRC